MTTPREDAIAALRHDITSLRETAAEQAIGHADSGGRSFDHWEGQTYAYDEVLARLAALAPADPTADLRAALEAELQKQRSRPALMRSSGYESGIEFALRAAIAAMRETGR